MNIGHVEFDGEKGKKLAIMVTKGTLDWAYHPLILASTGMALGYEVQIFYTSYGLQGLNREAKLQVSSIGNPAMPIFMPMPVIMQMLPGMQYLISIIMNIKMRSKGVAKYKELREICIDSGVRILACQMSTNLFGLQLTDFIEGTEMAGLDNYLEFAAEADINLVF